MSQWSKHPPRREGLYLFRGVRLTRNNQAIRYNEPVRVQHVQVGQRVSLGVAMLGRARIYPVGDYHGEWAAIDVEVA